MRSNKTQKFDVNYGLKTSKKPDALIVKQKYMKVSLMMMTLQNIRTFLHVVKVLRLT
jgi:hypothetical protein